MKTNVSEFPARETGEYIHDLLRNNKNKQVLLLLSGGSALEVLSYIQPYILGPNLVIGVTDERFTNAEGGNNFKQIQKTQFYAKAKEQGAQFINSAPVDGENFDEYTKRLQDALGDFFKQYPENYAIGLFGIGEDGHTASIFPAPENEFIKTYYVDTLYVQSSAENSVYKERVTITPMVIEDMLDAVILYATGENKCNTVLQYMHNNTFADHQLPALIPARHQDSELFTDCSDLV